MELNKYQSLKKPKEKQHHILHLMTTVGNIADVYNNNIENIGNEELTVMLGEVLEDLTALATLNNITLDTVAGININSYQPNMHNLIDVGDTVTYEKERYIVHDVIGNQLLIANRDKDLVIDINSLRR
ncbi:hypothetical protein HMPREF2713_08950 [Staphylococcus sp. HMSC059E03]|uniref:hypothetical protein n=1 Tax=Staphylococcus TaxID=1279 RepID=UPI000763D64D|nr:MULTISPECIES: hypothetical protein [Staphylococcus]KXA42123.1 hypothetical protein HMPREF3215_02223 [Staphylococcus simulans]OFM15724.1 hypothetical protein HMPREF2713_08950 [Staphylococcus sp. HMSC059E03]OFN23405.1 hypothetical protein HMPREF2603_09550 [Staphylococcus sp. HMSC055C03]OFV03225.1 hypothetical protein HMPREF3124_12385 [Staphylococcus sp. HMSC12H08]